MTIVTKPLSEKKQDVLKKPLVITGAEQNDGNCDLESLADPFHVIPNQPITVGAQIGLFLFAMLVLALGICSGLYLYRQMVYIESAHRFQGWFQIPSLRDSQSQSLINMTEQYDIDMDADTANINVPDFANGRRGRFIHDFNSNKTGIVDIEGKRCFVMPLNRLRVLPPRTMYDLISKIWDGYYEVDTEMVRETYRVDLPPITRIQDMGRFIFNECAGLPTYRLRRDRDILFKRSVQDVEEFQEFAGKKMMRFRIIMNGVSEYERDHQNKN